MWTEDAFAQGDWLFDKDSAVEAYANTYVNKSGSLTGNDGGRITIDVETIGDAWDAGDVIYGSVTDYILEVKGLSGTQIQLNQYVHGTNVYQLALVLQSLIQASLTHSVWVMRLSSCKALR